MDEMELFRENLAELLQEGTSGGGTLSMQQVSEAFGKLPLSDAQWEMIIHYLELNHIQVEGHERSAQMTEGFAEPEGAGEDEEPLPEPKESGYLAMYREELGSILPASEEESRLLFEGMLRDDEEMRKRFIETRLMMAARAASFFAGQGVAEADLIQEANMSLLIAAAEYEGEFEGFDAYAEEEIRNSLADLIEEETGNSRMEAYMASQANMLLQISTEMAQELGREATIGELCERMNMTEDALRELMKESVNAATVVEGSTPGYDQTD